MSRKNNSKMEIGIIGFGRFGKLITKYLSEDKKVYVFSRSLKDGEIRKSNGIPASLEDVCKKDIVIPCVPISQLEGTLKKIKGMLKDNLVIDVCSVKEYPVAAMKRILHEKTGILATHPIFGPDSAAETVKGRKIVLCRVRIQDEKYEKIKSCLEKKGLVVIESTPEKHDKEIAKTLVLAHFIGRGLIGLGAKNLEIDTEGYRRLMDVLETVKNDTEQLFEDMNRYNKYSKEIRKGLIKSLARIDRRLEK